MIITLFLIVVNIVFTSQQSGKNDVNRKGDLIAYSSNNEKSFTPIYFPPISDNPETAKGYAGSDEFAVVENTLVRRFPKVVEGKTIGTKQIQYKLTKGARAAVSCG